MSQMIEVIVLVIRTFANALFSVFSLYQQASDIVDNMVAEVLGIPVLFLTFLSLIKLAVLIYGRLISD